MHLDPVRIKALRLSNGERQARRVDLAPASDGKEVRERIRRFRAGARRLVEARPPFEAVIAAVERMNGEKWDESRVFEQAPDKERGAIRRHVQLDKAVLAMAKDSVEEPPVLSEEGHVSKPVEQRNNVRILYAEVGYLAADLAKRDTPTP